MQELSDSFETTLVLGIAAMDDTHREFVELISQLSSADDTSFRRVFGKLVRHTELHFEAENELMLETGFPATREHMDEHRRVMGELNRMLGRVEAGSLTMPRAWIREQVPSWFRLHVLTMDSALAGHISKRLNNPAAHGRSTHQHPGKCTSAFATP